jgi:hypothetical protein
VIVKKWEGIDLQVVEAALGMFPWHFTYKDFPDCYCGAGDGFWEKVVPDYVYIPPIIIPGANPARIKVSPACANHDIDWEVAAPSWDDFHESNSRFYANLKSIIECKTIPGSATRYYALRSPAIYAGAVDTAGRKHFWRLKKEQGYKIPDSAGWLLR